MSYILLIPGLGDEQSLARVRQIEGRWGKKVPAVLFFDPRWHTDELYEDKFKRLKDFTKNKDIEAVMGISAGASLAVSWYTDNKKTEKVYLVAGKFVYPERIGRSFQKRAPQLKPAVEASEKALASL